MVVMMRHAETDLNVPPGGGPEILRGALDPPLNAAGREAAGKSWEKLCSKYPVKQIRASHFQRDWQTAEIGARLCGAPIVLDDRLAPWDIGAAAGKPRIKMWRVLDWFRDHPQVSIPGGKPYITYYGELKAAVFDALAESAADPESVIVLVAQGNSFRALPAILQNDDFSKMESTAEVLVRPGDVVFLPELSDLEQ